MTPRSWYIPRWVLRVETLFADGIVVPRTQRETQRVKYRPLGPATIARYGQGWYEIKVQSEFGPVSTLLCEMRGDDVFVSGLLGVIN